MNVEFLAAKDIYFNADWNENMDEDSGFEKWNQYTIVLNLHSFQFVSRQQLLRL